MSHMHIMAYNRLVYELPETPEAKSAIWGFFASAKASCSASGDSCASSASTRFETLRILSEVGIPTSVSLAPVIPGLNDDQIPEVLERARAAGATGAFMMLLRLPSEVAPVFEQRLRETYPERHAKVMNAVREMRGGKLYEARFGQRMRGRGERWRTIERVFELHRKRLGLQGAFAIHADGEMLSLGAHRLTVEVVPAGLSVLVPGEVR